MRRQLALRVAAVLPPSFTARGAFLDGDALLILDLNGIAALDGATLQVKTVLPRDGYYVTAIAASSTGELTYAAFRPMDLSSVIGTCTVAAGCEVINASAPQLGSLLRLD